VLIVGLLLLLLLLRRLQLSSCLHVWLLHLRLFAWRLHPLLLLLLLLTSPTCRLQPQCCLRQ
jgi:hypothetical protein